MNCSFRKNACNCRHFWIIHARNQAKVDGSRGDVRRLESLLAELNSKMVSATTGENSLAEKAVQIQLAQADLATRDLMLQTALQTLEQARRDALARPVI